MGRWGLLLCGLILTASLAEAGPWKDDFNRLCAQTATAEGLSVHELDNLAAECDRVIQVVGRSDAPERKVYLFRLKKCRNLYAYLSEVKKRQADR